MELTRSSATRRLAELKRRGVVQSLTVSADSLAVRVVHLNDDARYMVEEALSGTGWTVSMTDAKLAKPKIKPAGKKAEPLWPAEQRRRFEELSRELGTDNGETLDQAFGKIVPPKLRPQID